MKRMKFGQFDHPRYSEFCRAAVQTLLRDPAAGTFSDSRQERNIRPARTSVMELN